MEKTKNKTSQAAKQKQNAQQFQDVQQMQGSQQVDHAQQIEDMQAFQMQPEFFDATAMPEVSGSPVMPICAVMPMPFDPFCPQFSPEEALRKGTLFKWLYSPYTPCAPKPRRKCTC